jgi:succinate dehydrogenase/fumarate reductase-like Fe-S protein
VSAAAPATAAVVVVTAPAAVATAPAAVVDTYYVVAYCISIRKCSMSCADNAADPDFRLNAALTAANPAGAI